jgi:hypothetical protein
MNGFNDQVHACKKRCLLYRREGDFYVVGVAG